MGGLAELQNNGGGGQILDLLQIIGVFSAKCLGFDPHHHVSGVRLSPPPTPLEVVGVGGGQVLGVRSWSTSTVGGVMVGSKWKALKPASNCHTLSLASLSERKKQMIKLSL